MFLEPELVEVQEFSVISGLGGKQFLSVPTTSNLSANMHQQQFVVAAAPISSKQQQVTHHEQMREEFRDNHTPLMMRRRPPPPAAVDTSIASSTASSTLDQLRTFLMNRSPSSSPSRGGLSSSSRGRVGSPVMNSDNAPPSKRVEQLRSHFAAKRTQRRPPPATAPGLLGMLHSIGVFAESSATATQQWQRSRRTELSSDFQARQQAHVAAKTMRQRQQQRLPPSTSSARSSSPAPALPPHALPSHHQHQPPRRCSSAPTVSSMLRSQKAARSLERQQQHEKEERRANSNFTPAITASAHRLPTRGHDSMFREHARLQSRQEQRRAASREREGASLPFAPKVSTYTRRPHSSTMPIEDMFAPQHQQQRGPPVTSALSDLDAYFREIKERERLRDMIRHEAEEEKIRKEMEQCTFRPATAKLPGFMQRMKF